MALRSTDIPTSTRPTRGSERAPARAAVTAVGVTVRRRQRVVLHDVNVSVARGELVAIAGASGAGKTTLLRVLAALERPAAGRVDHAETGPSGTRASIGFVPQDDIVHRELPVRSTLRYAAALRLPASAGTDEREAAVAELLDELGLAERAGVRVGALSGGQRKRVSIAVELLRRPSLLLLDEPTSGLDPATAAGVMSLLARIARRGVAVVVTTHREADLEQCDRVVFLGRTGRIAADGPLAAVLAATGASRIADIYERVAASSGPGLDEKPPAPVPAAVAGAARERGAPGGRRSSPAVRPIGAMRQALVLTRRNAEVMARNPLTLAVLLGSPLLVTIMMATLFGPAADDARATGGTGTVQVAFWLAFAGFFFGLTYGLLQVVTERAVLERERFAGLDVSAYLLAKVLVLAPMLTAVAAVLLVTLRLLDRLPQTSTTGLASLLGIVVLESMAALALGLLTSTLVREASQATLALPMLCFPQVLFAGAVVPVADLTAPGHLLSYVLINRWAFEAIGRGLALSHLPAAGAHGAAFTGTSATGAAWLAVATAVLLVLAAVAVRQTTPRPRR